MKTAVDKVGRGKARTINARFFVPCPGEAMTSHYLFEPEFCNVASGWEKGIVEMAMAKSSLVMPEHLNGIKPIMTVKVTMRLAVCGFGDSGFMCSTQLCGVARSMVVSGEANSPASLPSTPHNNQSRRSQPVMSSPRNR